MESYAETDLEKEFEKVFSEHNAEIQEKLAAAVKLINEAEAIAEKYGLPFRPNEHIMWCRPSYIPESMKEKFPQLEQDFWSTVTNAWGDERYAGWQSSQVC